MVSAAKHSEEQKAERSVWTTDNKQWPRAGWLTRELSPSQEAGELYRSWGGRHCSWRNERVGTPWEALSQKRN